MSKFNTPSFVLLTQGRLDCSSPAPNTSCMQSSSDGCKASRKVYSLFSLPSCAHFVFRGVYPGHELRVLFNCCCFFLSRPNLPLHVPLLLKFGAPPVDCVSMHTTSSCYLNHTGTFLQHPQSHPPLPLWGLWSFHLCLWSITLNPHSASKISIHI